jgi:hypothetical protein
MIEKGFEVVDIRHARFARRYNPVPSTLIKTRVTNHHHVVIIIVIINSRSIGKSRGDVFDVMQQDETVSTLIAAPVDEIGFAKGGADEPIIDASQDVVDGKSCGMVKDQTANVKRFFVAIITRADTGRCSRRSSIGADGVNENSRSTVKVVEFM